MKALISPDETFTLRWASAWQQQNSMWVPVMTEIPNCLRVAQTVSDNEIFDVALPLFWTDCPDNCLSDLWYYKDGNCYLKPVDEPMPPTQVQTLP